MHNHLRKWSETEESIENALITPMSGEKGQIGLN